MSSSRHHYLLLPTLTTSFYRLCRSPNFSDFIPGWWWLHLTGWGCSVGILEYCTTITLKLYLGRNFWHDLIKPMRYSIGQFIVSKRQRFNSIILGISQNRVTKFMLINEEVRRKDYEKSKNRFKSRRFVL